MSTSPNVKIVFTRFWNMFYFISPRGQMTYQSGFCQESFKCRITIRVVRPWRGQMRLRRPSMIALCAHSPDYHCLALLWNETPATFHARRLDFRCQVHVSCMASHVDVYTQPSRPSPQPARDISRDKRRQQELKGNLACARMGEQTTAHKPV